MRQAAGEMLGQCSVSPTTSDLGMLLRESVLRCHPRQRETEAVPRAVTESRAQGQPGPESSLLPPLPPTLIPLGPSHPSPTPLPDWESGLGED